MSSSFAHRRVRAFAPHAWERMARRARALETRARQLAEEVARHTQLDATMRGSEERYRLMVELSPDALFVQRRGRIVFANAAAAKLLGAPSANDLCGRAWESLVHHDDSALFAPLPPEEGVDTVDARVVRDDGEPVYVAVTRCALTFAGEPCEYLAVRDATERCRTDAAMRETAERYRTMIAALAEGITFHNADGTILADNAAAEKILGLAPEDLIGHRPDDGSFRMVREDGTPLPLDVFPALETLRTGRAIVGAVLGFERSDGQRVWLSVNAQPLFRPGESAPHAAVVSFTDITRLQLAQAERERLLREADTRRQIFEAVIANTPAAIGLVRGPDFVLDVINPALARITPMSMKLGRPAFENAQSAFVAGVKRRFEETLASGQPYRAVDQPIEVPGPDGQTQTLNFTFVRAPLKLPGGDTAILIAGIETTEQVEARRQLEELAAVARRRAAELQAVIDSMVDAVFVCDASGRVVMANKAGGDLMDRGGVTSPAPGESEIWAALGVRALDGSVFARGTLPLERALAGETVPVETLMARLSNDEREVFFRCSAVPIRNADDAVVAAVEVARDVTELVELDRLKDQFVRIAAHELKTPVAIIKGHAQLLLRASDEFPAARKAVLDAIASGADRIDRIVDDLLYISQLELGRLRITAAPVNLAALVERTAKRMSAAGQRAVRVVHTAPAEVAGDRERLEYVLLTLMDNGLRYSPEGGEVQVELEVRDGREAVVTVIDHGVGIAREKQARIFERFYRAHTDTPHDYGGMGVGLFIARQIVERHGGRIWFESAEGVGSRFHFSVPLRR